MLVEEYKSDDNLPQVYSANYSVIAVQNSDEDFNKSSTMESVLEPPETPPL